MLNQWNWCVCSYIHWKSKEYHLTAAKFLFFFLLAGTANTALLSASPWWTAVGGEMGNFPAASMTPWSVRASTSNREALQTRRTGAETTAWAAAAAYPLTALLQSHPPTLSPKPSRPSATPTVSTGWVEYIKDIKCNLFRISTIILSFAELSNIMLLSGDKVSYLWLFCRCPF